MKRIQRVFGDIDTLRFVDDLLDDERRAAFVAHLASEPEEAERAAVWLRQNDAVRAAFASVAAETVPVWLRLGNLEEELRPAVVDPRGIRRSDSIPVAKLVEPAPAVDWTSRTRSIGLAAMGVIVAGGLVLAGAAHLLPTALPMSDNRAQSTAQGARAVVVRATDAYRTFAIDATHPVEIAATQQPLLERWLQRRLSMPVRAPDLREEGWSLLGGRLAPGDFGPAAFFVYEDSGADRMGLYVAKTGSEDETRVAIDKMTGGSTMAWTAGPVDCVIAAGKDAEWMAHNGESLRASVARAMGD